MTLWQLIRSDYRAIFERDPAATNRFEVLLTYTSFHAVFFYRIAHAVLELGIPVLPRLISTLARFLSGVEIHPAAQIGPRFVIDHGTGVVIGETTEIGDNCLLFQGVTLGGTGKEHKKRHPTLGDHVVVGAGAKILGSMRIGNHTKIGSNAVVLSPVPDHCTVVGVPGRIVRVKGELPDEGMDHVHMPDPIAERFRELEGRVADLQAAVTASEARAERAQGLVREMRATARKAGPAATPKPRASLTRKRRATTRKPGR